LEKDSSPHENNEDVQVIFGNSKGLQTSSIFNNDILLRNRLLHETNEGQIREVKEEGRRRTQLVDLGNGIRYWELKEEA
jgi:hypothetical protein